MLTDCRRPRPDLRHPLQIQGCITNIRTMRSVALEEAAAVAGRCNIQRILEINLEGPRQLLADFTSSFPEVMQLEDTEAYVNDWMAAGHLLQETRSEVLRLQQVGSAHSLDQLKCCC